jgi:hypothetical protein
VITELPQRGRAAERKDATEQGNGEKHGGAAP